MGGAFWGMMQQQAQPQAVPQAAPVEAAVNEIQPQDMTYAASPQMQQMAQYLRMPQDLTGMMNQYMASMNKPVGINDQQAEYGRQQAGGMDPYAALLSQMNAPNLQSAMNAPGNMTVQQAEQNRVSAMNDPYAQMSQYLNGPKRKPLGEMGANMNMAPAPDYYNQMAQYMQAPVVPSVAPQMAPAVAPQAPAPLYQDPFAPQADSSPFGRWMAGGGLNGGLNGGMGGSTI